MRRSQLWLTMIALPTFAFCVLIAGCGKEEKKDTSSNSGSGSGSGSGDSKDSGKELKVLEPKGGKLKGTVTLKGTPELEKLNTELRNLMKEKDNDVCMKGSESETTEQEYRVGEGNKLGNVFVWITPDTGTFFQVTDQMLKGLDKEVKVHQPHCAFIPHSAFLFSQYHPDPKKPKDLKPTGQALRVANDAEISHNTNWKGGSLNSGDNVMLSSSKDRLVDNLKPEASPVTIKCDIHKWMNAYLFVVDTPYFAISHSDTLDGKAKVDKKDAKFGTYEISNLPVGKVKIRAWHEKAGYLNQNGGQGEVIEIMEGGKDTTKDFTAEVK